MNASFNVNYYIVIATINPIFFLPLTLQGTFYGSLIQRINRTTEGISHLLKEGEEVSWKTPIDSWVVLVLWQLAIAILAAGIGSEVASLLALYRQQASSGVQQFTLWATVGIIVVTAITPGWTVLRALYSYNLANIRLLIFIVKDTWKDLMGSQDQDARELQTEISGTADPDHLPLDAT